MSFFEKDGCRFYYETDGGGPPLVLLHGLSADGFTWATVRRELAAHFTLIIPDNRFSGRSSCQPETVSPKQLAEDLRGLLDFLQVKKVSVAGHSMGGYIAQEFALNFPERTDKLVLEATAACSSPRNNELFGIFAQMLSRDGYTELFWRNFLAWILSPSVYAEPGRVDEIVKFTLRYPYLASPENFVLMGAIIAGHDTRSRLKDIKAETLVIAGERDILITPQESRAMCDGIAGAEFSFFEGSGHNAHFEAAERFARTVIRFLGG